MARFILSPLNRPATMTVLVICLLAGIAGWAMLTPGTLFAASGPTGDAGPSILECRGTVMPSRIYQLWLNPEERLANVWVQKGQRVTPTQKLATVTFPGSARQAAAYRDRIFQLDEKEQQVRLLDVQIAHNKIRLDMERKHLAIGEQAVKGLPNYVFEAKRLESLQRTADLEGTISLLEAQKEMALELRPQRQELRRRLVHLLNDLEADVDGRSIVSPIGGEVVFVHDDPDRAAPGARILELWSVDTLVIKADVLQNQVLFLRIGQHADIYSGLSSAKVGKGVVSGIEPPRDLKSIDHYPHFSITIELTEVSEPLRAGMSVYLELLVSLKPNR